jgi:hypothetical protein
VPVALAVNCADDVHTLPLESVAVAVIVVSAPAGRPDTVTDTGRSSSSDAVDTVIEASTEVAFRL